MTRYRTVSGIIIRRKVLPAGDLFLEIFAPSGKEKAIAKSGARGSNSAKLNLFQHITCQLYERPGRDLAQLTQVILEGALIDLTKPGIYPHAHFLAELTSKLWQEKDLVGQAPFELLAGGLRGLVRHPNPSLVSLVIGFKLLAVAGLFPKADSLGLPENSEKILERIGSQTVRQIFEKELSQYDQIAFWRVLRFHVTDHVGELLAWP